MEKIGPASFGTIGHIGGRSCHFRNHGQASKKARKHIAYPNGQQIAIVVGFATERVNIINSLHCEERLYAAYEGEKHHKFYECA